MAISDEYDAFLLDLDGTCYLGDSVVPGAPEAVERLRHHGKRTVFLTNNSGRTPEEVSAKLERLGIRAEPHEVVTSALVTAKVLADRGAKTAFVVGMSGIRAALQAAGIEVVDGQRAQNPDYVVVGWDGEADYDKLKTAGLLVQRGARLIATNPDASYPAPDGLWPGAGALLAVITTTTGIEAEIVGKPRTPLLEEALRQAGGGRPLVVGDRLDTDIAAAAGLGWDSLLVLTGVASRADIRKSPANPTYVGEDLGSLFSPASELPTTSHSSS